MWVTYLREFHVLVRNLGSAVFHFDSHLKLFLYFIILVSLITGMNSQHNQHVFSQLSIMFKLPLYHKETYS